MSKYAPKIIRMTINPDKIRDVIGAGGKVINKIIEETGVKIDIEDDGSVMIAAENVEDAYKAKKIIEGIVKEIEVGEIMLGKVEDVLNLGDEILVKVIEIDNQGKIKLSRKEALKEADIEKEKKAKSKTK